MEGVPSSGDANWLQSLDAAELSSLIEAAQWELLARVSDRGDLDAILERAFSTGFDHKGMARRPWVEGELVVCPGARIAASPASHRCRFVACGDAWAWQVDDAVADEMRPRGPVLHTVTLLAARPGIELDVVTSQARGGVHRRQSSVRYRLDGGRLTEVLTQGAGPGRDHR